MSRRPVIVQFPRRPRSHQGGSVPPQEAPLREEGGKVIPFEKPLPNGTLEVGDSCPDYTPDGVEYGDAGAPRTTLPILYPQDIPFPPFYRDAMTPLSLFASGMGTLALFNLQWGHAWFKLFFRGP